MRALGFLGLASAMVLLPAAAAMSADAPAAGGSSMSTGVAQSRGSGGWGNVPDTRLNPPAGRPGGWGPGGWNGGNPGSPGLPGTPGGPAAPGLPGGPGVPGAPGMPPAARPAPPPQAGIGRPDRPRRWGHGAWRGGDRRGGYDRYPRYSRGQVLPRHLLGPNLYVQDWWSYGLGRPGYGQNWLRYYDDALLVDDYGRVIDERYGLDWDRRGDGYQAGNYDYGWGREDFGGTTSEVHPLPGGGKVVVHSGGGPWGGASTVVVVQNPPTVTTTTKTTYEDVVVPRGTKKRWKPKPACRCK